MKISYEPVIDCIIKHSLKILHGNYENSAELFNYSKQNIYPKKIADVAEIFGMMMVKLEARELALQQTIDKLRAKEQEIRHLYEVFVESMTAAIDSRDTATAGHSKRVAAYAVAFCNAINNTDQGRYQATTFSENEIREFHYAALLHDVGKIGVNENILLKKNHLSSERLSVIFYRLKYCKQCLRWKKKTCGLTPPESELLANIDLHYEFIAAMNKRDRLSSDETAQLKAIATMSFADENGVACHLLDAFEKQNLLVRQGNLTDAEKQALKMHPVYTADILNCIPWEEDMRQLVAIAAGHHEKLDGSGYPNGLKAPDLPIQTRMLAIIDIFDALTAFDRPYKPPLPTDQALEILHAEMLQGHLDGDLLTVFCAMINAEANEKATLS